MCNVIPRGNLKCHRFVQKAWIIICSQVIKNVGKTRSANDWEADLLSRCTVSLVSDERIIIILPLHPASANPPRPSDAANESITGCDWVCILTMQPEHRELHIALWFVGCVTCSLLSTQHICWGACTKKQFLYKRVDQWGKAMRTDRRCITPTVIYKACYSVNSAVVMRFFHTCINVIQTCLSFIVTLCR